MHQLILPDVQVGEGWLPTGEVIRPPWWKFWKFWQKPTQVHAPTTIYLADAKVEGVKKGAWGRSRDEAIANWYRLHGTTAEFLWALRAGTTRCGEGHPTEQGEPGENYLACGCLARTATDQALRDGGYPERPCIS